MDTRQITRAAGRFRRSALTAVLVGCGLTLLSCYPGDELNPSDTDIIATFQAPGFDFSTVRTYAMPDSVAHADGENFTFAHRGYDDTILSSVDRGMQAMGFTPATPSTADVLVVNFSTTTDWVAGGCYDYWYYGWYYPYGGYCYPTYYTYETGTVVTLMFKRTSGTPTTAPTTIWASAINGLTTGSSGTELTRRINENMDQAFAQSPYLGNGK